MARIELNSTLIKAIYYEPASATLDVYFKDGHERVYHEVPNSIVNQLVTAESPGTYYMNHIRRCFPHN